MARDAVSPDMRRLLLLTPALLLLVACTGDGEDSTIEDPAPAGQTISDPPPRPSAVPPAPDDVVSRHLITVLETREDGTVACLGLVAESAPPQCDGPVIEGWDWEKQGRYAERAAGIRWGSFSIRGTFDGTTITLAEAVPAALFDPGPTDAPSLPDAAGDRTPAELEKLGDELGRGLPGAQGFSVEGGLVLVDVTYDDGSLQEWADDTYGEGVVVVSGQLVDA